MTTSPFEAVRLEISPDGKTVEAAYRYGDDRVVIIPTDETIHSVGAVKIRNEWFVMP
ncbi:hypothetical protein VPHD81_0067 [Vibrio phage D81]